MELYEYIFVDGAKVTDFLKPECISDIRQEYAGNCYGFARDYQYWFTEANILCSVLTFKNGNAFCDGGIKVWNDISQSYETYTHHSVILLGDCIMDLLNSDRLIATPEYVRKLKEHNPKLRLDYVMSGMWINSQGDYVQVTLEKLKSGDWD